MSKLYTQKPLVMPASRHEAEILALKDSILQNISQVVSDADPGKRQLCHNYLKEIGDAPGIPTNMSPVPNIVIGVPIKSLYPKIAIQSNPIRLIAPVGSPGCFFLISCWK